jgi:hypothetical protein
MDALYDPLLDPFHFADYCDELESVFNKSRADIRAAIGNIEKLKAEIACCM